MLSDLIVHNFAIIHSMDVAFGPGLNVLSGETGAGKSILVGAVNLILGSRASQEMIRTGANEAAVEALFTLANEHPLLHRLEEWGLGSSSEIVVRRSINRNGRNRVFVNEQLITLQQLQGLSRGLISISGQHEHQSLLDPDVHLGLLDRFGSQEGMAAEVQEIYSRWATVREALHRMRRQRQEKAAQRDFLQFQLKELESARLQPGEDEALEAERNILRHAATLREAAHGAYQSLYAGRGAVLEILAGVEKSLNILKSIDASQESLLTHLEQGRIHLEELAHALQGYAHKINFDPQRQAWVEERLALIQKLGKKYGPTVDAMLGRMEEFRQTLGNEEDAEYQEGERTKELAALREEYLGRARELSSARRKAAERLAGDVAETLAALDMSRARFSVAFQEDVAKSLEGEEAEKTFSPTGLDRVEFLLSANPGEDLKPLARIASGGELSRILLALKSLLSRQGEAETLIFDEVDTGIGGRTAELVGLQLQRLADKHQVICITHLPQIARYGTTHYKVAKETGAEMTQSRIRVLSPEERVEEMARMLGGISISETTREHARELLLTAQHTPGAA